MKKSNHTQLASTFSKRVFLKRGILKLGFVLCFCFFLFTIGAKKTRAFEICGQDPWQNSNGTAYTTGCYTVNIGGSVVPKDPQNPDGWACGPTRQCFYFDPVSDYPQGFSCTWKAIDNGANLCMSGWKDATALRKSSVYFKCEGTCGGLISEFWLWLTGNQGQSATLSNTPDTAIFHNDDGTVGTCAGGGFDQGIVSIANDYFNKQAVACVTTGATAAVLSGGQSLIFSLASGAGSCAFTSKFFDFGMSIDGNVKNGAGQTICADNLPIKVQAGTVQANPNTGQSPPFELCDQIAPGKEHDDCVSCSGTRTEPKDAMYTAVGCISTKPTQLIQTLLTLGLSIAGTVALLMILAAGFMLTTSSGNTEQIKQAREMLTGAVVGLVFIILSITILQFVGHTIFQIPGFAGS